MERPDVHPRTIGQVIDAGVSLYVSHFGAATVAAALVTLPVALLQLWNARDIPAIDLVDGIFGFLDDDVAGQLTGYGVGSSLIDLFATFMALSLAIAVFVPAYHGRPATWQIAARTVGRNVVLLLTLGILFMVGGAIGLVLLIFPGLWLLTVWSNSIPAMFDQGLRPVAALDRSFRLVKGRFFQMLGILLLTLGLQATLSYVGVLVTLAAGWLTGTSPSFVVTDVLTSAITSLFTIPLLGGVLTAAYFDHRTRREGLDLEIGLSSLPGSMGIGTPDLGSDDDIFGLDRLS